MKFQLAVFSLCSIAFSSAATLPGTEPYATLYTRCINAGGNTYIAILYSGGLGGVEYKFGDCIPFTKGSSVSEEAVFCQNASCNIHPEADCSGGSILPFDVAVYNGTTSPDLSIVLGTGLVAQSLRCTAL